MIHFNPYTLIVGGVTGAELPAIYYTLYILETQKIVGVSTCGLNLIILLINPPNKPLLYSIRFNLTFSELKVESIT